MLRSHRKPADSSRLPIRLLAACGCLVAVLISASMALAQDAVDVSGEQQLFTLINQERAKAGLEPYTLDQRLTRAARKHSQLMIDRDSLMHQLLGEDPLVLRLSSEGVRCDHDGENIALNGDVASAHVALMDSAGHRANILAAHFNSVGIGVVHTGDLVYVTEDFAHVMPDYSEFEADAAAQQSIADYARGLGLPVPARHARTQLARMACDMAQQDKLDSSRTREIAGVTAAVAWTATDLRKLPIGLQKILSRPVSSGYSLGVCFSPSASQPGGVYWLLFVTY